MNEQDVKQALNQNEETAVALLKQKDKLERYLERLEEKLRSIDTVGSVLGEVPVLISLIRAYVKKEYTDIPYASIVAILGALLYLLAPVDLIADLTPGIGLVDDIAVIGFAMRIVKADLDVYKQWKNEHYPR